MRSPTVLRGENKGLVVGMEPRDAQAPPRVGPLWIFEGRYTAPTEFRGGRQHGVAMEALPPREGWSPR